MRTSRILMLLAFALMIGVEPTASAQIYPDDRMTEIFERQLSLFAARGGAAFVSSCSGPQEGTAAVLVVPLDGSRGRLALLTGNKVYNAAGISIEKGEASAIDALGGVWSQAVIRFLTKELAKSEFRLVSGDALRNLTKLVPTRPCPTFEWNPPLPNE